MIIDSSFFVGEVDIPTKNSNIEPALNAFIEKYEKKFLIGLLGYELYLLFVAAIAIDPIEGKYQKLLHGDTYVYKDVTYLWEGLKEVITEPDAQADPPVVGKYRSIIANYVYYWWIRNQETQNTGIGVVATKAENSKRVSGTSKAVRAMSDLKIAMRNFIWYMQYKNGTYAEFNERVSVKFIYDNIIGINEFNI